MIALTQPERSALSLLRRAADKASNPGEEMRDTKQAAEYLSVETRKARKILEALFDRELVNGFKDTATLVWSITPAGRTALSKGDQ